MSDEKSKGCEKRHFQVLHMRLMDLIVELNSMAVKRYIVIPLLYKDLVNKINNGLIAHCPEEYKYMLKEDIKLNHYLY